MVKAFIKAVQDWKHKRRMKKEIDFYAKLAERNGYQDKVLRRW